MSGRSTLRRALLLLLLAVLAGALVSASAADPSSTVSIDDVTVTEGDSGSAVATFTVALNAESSDTVTVDYATTDGTAASPADYTSANGTLTFDPGQTSKTVQVSVNGDTLDEDDETLFLNLNTPTNASLGDAQGLGTITDDDPLPQVAIDDATVTEGDTGTVTASFRVLLTPASGRAVTVQYATSDATARAPADYAAASGELVIPAGETTKQVTVPVQGDTLDEDDESFGVTLSAPTNATITDGSAVGTITDDDPPPTLSIGDAILTEGDTGHVSGTFTVALSTPSARSVSVDYATTNGTATAPADYAAAAGSLTFAAGESTKTVTVDVAGDALDEVDETFTLALSNPVNATIGDTLALGTIVDDDPQPTLTIGDAVVTEGDAGTVDATFNVGLSAPSGRAISVEYATENGTATAPADYQAVAGTVTFAAGDVGKQVTVKVNGDVLDEANETFTVTLANAVNASIGDVSGLGTVTDDDPLPTLSIGDATVTEGNAGSINTSFTVTLSGASGRTVTVHYATSDESAAAGTDYTGASGLLSFSPGETTKTVGVTVDGDVLDEADETFAITLSGAVGATLGDGQGRGTIADDDATPTLSIDNVPVVEGNSGTVNATFVATLSAASGRDVTVNYATANGTAVSPGDYGALGGQLTFPSGETSKQITVLVKGDLFDEASETYFVNLSGPTNATLADDQGVGTIIDDDGKPVLSIDDVTVTEGHSGNLDATFRVTLSPASGQTVSVGYATSDGTATAGSDYTTTGNSLVFAPGDTSRQLTVPVKGDTLDEPDETFFVNLASPVNADIVDPQGLGTIVDDDPPPTVSIDDVLVTEGQSGTVNATFTAGLSAASAKPITVNFASADGTASAGNDYEAAAATLTFAPGTTTRPVAVRVKGDTLDEPDETFTVNLSAAANTTIADGVGLATIADDDPAPGLSVNDVTVTEGDAGQATATFTISLSAASGKPITVDYATAAGTASPADFQSTTGTLAFAPGQTTKTVTVSVQGDLLDEVDETYTLNLANAGNATIARAQGTGTITDNDPQPTISVNDVTVTEGNNGTTAANFAVRLNAPSGRSVAVGFATANGTAVAPDDYQARTGTLTFAPGQTTQQVTILVSGDTVNENNEIYSLNLSNPTNATIADDHAAGTIIDDDGSPALTIDDVTVTEGNAGTVTATFTVVLAPGSGKTVSVGYSTADDTAAAGSDYTSTGNSLVFDPGVTTRTVSVQVKADVLDEIDETYFVNLANPVNAETADGHGVGTIVDDDDPPSLSIADASSSEGNSGSGNTIFTVTLSRASGLPITVDYATANGTAIAPADYQSASGTLSFAPGQTTRTLTVLVNGDALDEDDETYLVNLSNPTNATVADPQASGAIADNDPLPVLAINDVTVAEGNFGTASATFTVGLNAGSGRTVSVDYRTADGTASAPADYTPTAGTLTFAAGVTSRTVTVPVNGDVLEEADETFVVALSNGINAAAGQSTGIGTIVNDEAAPMEPPPPAPQPPPLAAPPPPAAPTAPDTTPPREVSNLKLLAGDGKVTLSWRNPRDTDFKRVSVVRITPGKNIRRRAIYEAAGTSVTDRRVKNGTKYQYKVTTIDQAGNVSVGVRATATPRGKLFAPLPNAVLTGPPMLQWIAVRGATYYNVQLWRISGGGSQAAATSRPTKILSAWPDKPRYKLGQDWTFEAKRYSLTPGRYKWYVWPGLGKRSANRYRDLLGESSFTVTAKTATKVAKKTKRR